MKDETLRRLEKWVERNYPDEFRGKMVIGLRMCLVCGTPVLEWAEPSLDGKVAIEVDYGSANLAPWECGACKEVSRRAPEVFSWVLSVFRFQAEGGGGIEKS